MANHHGAFKAITQWHLIPHGLSWGSALQTGGSIAAHCHRPWRSSTARSLSWVAGRAIVWSTACFVLRRSCLRQRGRRYRASIGARANLDGATSGVEALRLVLEVAECTSDVGLAARVREQLEAAEKKEAILGDLAADLKLYDTFFRATEAPLALIAADRVRPGYLDDDWLRPLVEPRSVACGRNESLALAEREGVRLFSVTGDSEEAAAAAQHFHEHGFVVLLDALDGDTLEALQTTSAEFVRTAVRAAPDGNRGYRRYSMGRTTVMQASLAAVDSPPVCATLQKIWNSDSFTVQCCGGDFSMPAAEIQELHIDMPHRSLARTLYRYSDPEHPDRTFLDLPAPVVKAYFTMVDFNELTGPPRFVRGSQWRTSREDVPAWGFEPRSVRAYCPKGSAILMDQRVWHGGTPNISKFVRPMLSVHYSGPWYDESVLNDGGGMHYYRYHRGAVSAERLKLFRPRAQELCRHLCPPPGSPNCCAMCGTSITCGVSGLQGFDELFNNWYCLRCWVILQAQRQRGG